MTPSPKAQARTKSPKQRPQAPRPKPSHNFCLHYIFICRSPGRPSLPWGCKGWAQWTRLTSILYFCQSNLPSSPSSFIFSLSSTSTNNRSQAAPASQLGQLLVQNGSTNARPMVKGMTIANIMVDKENWSWFPVQFFNIFVSHRSHPRVLAGLTCPGTTQTWATILLQSVISETFFLIFLFCKENSLHQLFLTYNFCLSVQKVQTKTFFKNKIKFININIYTRFY